VNRAVITLLYYQDRCMKEEKSVYLRVIHMLPHASTHMACLMCAQNSVIRQNGLPCESQTAVIYAVDLMILIWVVDAAISETLSALPSANLELEESIWYVGYLCWYIGQTTI